MTIILSILLIIIDQVTKYVANIYLRPLGQIPVIKNIFYLSYVQNRGAAFGLMQGGKWLFIIITPIIIAFLIAYYLKNKNKVLKYATILIISGALGNFIDRLFKNYVTDFFDFLVWPVFNFADIFVCVGTGLLMYYVLIIDSKKSAGK